MSDKARQEPRPRIKPNAKVPGADFAELKAFGVCQALSWLAKERREIQEHIERKRQIDPLMQKLIAMT